MRFTLLLRSTSAMNSKPWLPMTIDWLRRRLPTEWPSCARGDQRCGPSAVFGRSVTTELGDHGRKAFGVAHDDVADTEQLA